MEGYVKLSRSFFDNEIWKTARAFSDCEAWLDLIQSARFEASPITSRIGSYEVTWGRGQYPASVRFLAKKWGRSEQWVRTLLGKLKRNKMIVTDSSQGVNIITLVNFEKYNGSVADNTPTNKVSNTPNTLSDSDIQRLTTHLITQLTTHPAENQHTPNTNNKKEEYKEISLTRDTEKKYSLSTGERDVDLVSCYNELSGSTIWIDTVVMNTRSSGYPNFDYEDFKRYLESFFRKLANEGVTEKSLKDAKSHFARWLKLELEHESNRANITTKQDANTYAQQQFLNYYANAHCGVSGRGEGE